MIGDVGYNDLYYPFRESLTKVSNHSGYYAIVNTHVKPQYFPITAQLMTSLLLILLSTVMINLLLGLAVADVQVDILNMFSEQFTIDILL